jgi:endonuclease/exonuclease/phosphatase family metal-dependent hydrolase
MNTAFASNPISRLKIALAILGLSIVFVESLPAEPIEMKIMSFNVRRCRLWISEDAAENNWLDARHPRRDRAIRVIRDNEPEILGVQEARELQINDLRKALPEFEFYGIGRDDGKTAGEYSGIFYRKDRFIRNDAGSFWLSPTPNKPGTTFSKVASAPPRVASWVRLEDQRAKRQLLVLNMHWDNASDVARRKSAELVRKRLATLAENVPAIVIGDLNGHEDSPEVVTLLGASNSNGPKLHDSYRVLHPERKPDESTSSDWNGRLDGSRIDFILHTGEFKPIAAEIVRTSYDGLWPSDHYPVTAMLQFKGSSQ